MRRLAALISGVMGGIAAVRWLRRTRRATAHEAAVGADEERADPRAETLRRRLEEARAVVGDQDEFDTGEVPVDRAEHAPPGPAERRRHVHAAARQAANAMRRRAQPGEDA